MPSSLFPAKSMHFNPYNNFKFRIKWDGVYVAGVSKVSGLTRTTQVVKYRAGGDPATARMVPGQTEYEPITLEQGVTHDAAFAVWANKDWDYGNAARDDEGAIQIVSLKDFRRDIVIEMYNEAGQKVLAYNIYRCWVMECTVLPELDGNGSAVAIQRIRLAIEGWERDTSVIEPQEASFFAPGSTPS